MIEIFLSFGQSLEGSNPDATARRSNSDGELTREERLKILNGLLILKTHLVPQKEPEGLVYPVFWCGSD